MQFGEKTKAIIGVALLCIAFFVGGAYLGYNDRGAIDSIVGIDNKVSEEVSADFDPFWRAWQLLDDRSIAADDVSDKDKVWGAIRGLASAYGDDYTEFFDPKAAEEFDEAISGEFSGVGMEVGLREGILTVIAPIKGTPAARAGIQAGDAILSINGESTAGMTVTQAVQKIRGEVGTSVKLSIFHQGDEEPKDVAITRAVIVVPSVETSIEGNHFIIEMATFTGNNINEDIEAAMRAFKSSGKKNLIIDLRGNPGGYLDAAIHMASYLLPAGQTVVTEDFGDKKDGVIHKSQGYPLIDNKATKVAVLIDGGSASASEILAGAIHDNGRGMLIGEKTFGKGSVQEIVQVTNDTILKITVAKWLTPKGISIQDNGITPEYVVELPADWEQGDPDPVMQKAKELLK